MWSCAWFKATSPDGLAWLQNFPKSLIPGLGFKNPQIRKPSWLGYTISQKRLRAVGDIRGNTFSFQNLPMNKLGLILIVKHSSSNVRKQMFPPPD